MFIECENCGHEWELEGEEEDYAACPKCEYKVKIPAEVEVVEDGKEEKKHHVEVPATVQVVTPEEEQTTFDSRENQFIEELVSCSDQEDVREVCMKYDQEEFNTIKKKIKRKGNRIKKDLYLYEEIEEVLEDCNWNYNDM